MVHSLTGQRALIVGATGGMGLASALALSKVGVQCGLIGRDKIRTTKAAETCTKAGTAAIPIICDISRIDDLEAMARQAISKLGGLNYLVNCSGVHIKAKAHEADLASWDEKLNINFRAIYHLARHTLPEINKNPGGAIINIGSITSAYSGAGLHLAVKRALSGYAEALFEDVREHGTKVCTIHPGYVNTSMARSDRLDPEKMIQPEDIAQAILFVLGMPSTACPTEITIRPQYSPYRTS